MVGLATLRRCHNHCAINQLEKIILGYSQMLGHCFRATFVKFDGEMRH